MWRIAVDTGGTFTDCIAISPQVMGVGSVHRAKVLSSARVPFRAHVAEDRRSLLVVEDHQRRFPGAIVQGAPIRISKPGDIAAIDDLPPIMSWQFDVDRWAVELDHPIDALTTGQGIRAVVEPRCSSAILAAHQVTNTPLNQPLPPMALRLATTRGTNALLTRQVAPAALFITRGFADLLAIGTQQRPDLFALDIIKRTMIYKQVVEVDERLTSEGAVLRSIDMQQLRADARRLFDAGIKSAAIAFLHSYRNAEHEQLAAEVLREAGFEHIACSADMAPLIEILPRAETAVVESAVGPIITEYLDQVSSRTGGAIDADRAASTLHIMTSAGGLAAADAFRACDSLLSGPAGGVAGAAAAGFASGFDRVIGFDMGGTSTDVSRFDGDFEYRFSHEVGDVRLLAPALAIETVAAGGGSICRFEDGQLRVGPDSAGADPGPACYGAGGPLTVTDVNVLSGRVDTERFGIPIDVAAARAALEDVLAAMTTATGDAPDRDEVIDGFLDIANQHMAAAIEAVSLGRGYDPKRYALVSFGGAGGQHACAIAEALGVDRIVCPADASILSAVGLLHAVIERFAQQQVLRLLADVGDTLPDEFDVLAGRAIEQVVSEGVACEEVQVRRRIVNARLAGQESTIAIDVERGDADEISSLFNGRYERLYGYPPRDGCIEIESMRVIASSRADDSPAMTGSSAEVPQVGQVRSDVVDEQATVRARFDRRWSDVPVIDRDALAAGRLLRGPALLRDGTSTVAIERHWSGSIDASGALVLRRVANNAGEGAGSAEMDDVRPDAVLASLFAHRLTSIGGEMGVRLQRTAMSTNVKQRLDFSCAMLNADGELVVNAPHIPVHLGSLGVCVRMTRDAIDMRPGDCIVTNHPVYGGSHLPDVTVISPVHVPDENGSDPVLVGYVANRAHHAEFGGSRPGSMPPTATTLIEEGVVISPMPLVRESVDRMDDARALLESLPHPSRDVEENVADLRAQVAANMHGVRAIAELVASMGVDEFRRRERLLAHQAEAIARRSLVERITKPCRATERLDDGSQLCVGIEPINRVNADDGGPVVRIDFAGTARSHPGNLNAPPAVARSAVLYVLRLLVGQRLPLNEAIMRTIDLHLPQCMLNPVFDRDDPSQCPAVVGGNVETSQRVVDTLIKALDVAGCAQGTMNNTLFGNDSFGYYETICGGAGATADADGADAVHTHMTNTRITDPEIMEHRYPVRLHRFAVRAGSGGAGQHRGGDGTVREIEFLEPVELSVVTQHRVERPYGSAGGEPGECGRQWIERADGSRIDLAGVDGATLHAGDRYIIETPGGGGYGPR